MNICCGKQKAKQIKNLPAQYKRTFSSPLVPTQPSPRRTDPIKPVESPSDGRGLREVVAAAGESEDALANVGLGGNTKEEKRK